MNWLEIFVNVNKHSNAAQMVDLMEDTLIRWGSPACDEKFHDLVREIDRNNRVCVIIEQKFIDAGLTGYLAPR